MGSRSTRPGVEKVYEAARKWVNRALRTDDSLFTPDMYVIWSSRWHRELRERFLDNPDESDASFEEKLEQQLSGSPPEVYQLMGEVLYFYFLIVQTANSTTEQRVINKVLGWSGASVSIPQELVDGLTPGLVTPGTFFHTGRAFQTGFIIEFVEQFKERESNEQNRLLDDPWKFKEFITQRLDFRSAMLRVHPNRSRPQRQAMLHLVFPDTFESIDRKNKIADASAFANYLTEPTDDVDRKLTQIRRSIEASNGRDFGFYDADIRVQWDPDFDPGGAPDPTDDEQIPKTRPLQALAEDIFLPLDFLQNVERLLEDKKQVIFQGPPGTGKTFVAQKLANHLAESEDRVTLVQFHPSYTYEDFVQGFRPKLAAGGQAGFEMRDGPLLRAAERAGKEPHAKHCLVIDEINRGNLSKVFGELYFLLEYRNKSMTLQYSERGKKIAA